MDMFACRAWGSWVRVVHGKACIRTHWARENRVEECHLLRGFGVLFGEFPASSFLSRFRTTMSVQTRSLFLVCSLFSVGRGSYQPSERRIYSRREKEV